MDPPGHGHKLLCATARSIHRIPAIPTEWWRYRRNQLQGVSAPVAGHISASVQKLLLPKPAWGFLRSPPRNLEAAKVIPARVMRISSRTAKSFESFSPEDSSAISSPLNPPAP